MFRIDVATAVDTLPTPGAVGPNPNYFFSSGDVDLENLPTTVDHDFLNALQEELANLVEGAGLTLSKSNRTQVRAAVLALIELGPSGPSGLLAVEDDTNPHLGGDLIFNGHNMFSSSTIDIVPNGTGNIVIDKANFAVKDKIAFGSSGLNKDLTFGTDTQNFNFAGSSIVGLNTTGLSILSGNNLTGILDEDNFASDSAVKTFTQQSGKAYVDNNAVIIPQYLTTIAETISAISGATPFTTGFFSQLVGATTDTNWYALVFPKSATITSMIVRHGGNNNGSSDDDLYLALFKNGSATAMTLTIPTGSGPGTVTATGSISVSAGDYVYFVPTSNPAGTWGGLCNMTFNEIGITIV